MKFHKTSLSAVYIIEPEKTEDQRGFFARSWDAKQFKELGLDSRVAQLSISNNKKKGTLRGLHYQIPPYEETKIVRCTRGKVFDVIVDLRKNSKTFKKWYSIELSADNYKMIYVPKGFATGYQTLVDNTDITYQMSEFYMPKYYRGIRWNDPTFNFKWPLDITVISENDKSWNYFKE